jgi:hypothetical protein
MKPPKILYTEDHKSFKKILSNRDLVPAHVRNLVADIQRRNLLHLFPIIVNSKMEVIEGQHRVAAAKELKLGIFYIVDDNVKSTDIAAINANRKSWSGKDYVRFYAREGRAEYKKLETIMSDYPKLTISGAIRLIEKGANYYTGGGQVVKAMRAGTLDATNYNMARQVCVIATELNPKLRCPYAFYRGFLLSIKIAYVQSELDLDDFQKRLILKARMLPNIVGVDESCVRTIKDLIL